MDPNDPVPSYEELCEKLRESFGPLRQTSYHRAEFSTITRGPTETVRALVERLRPVTVLAYPHVFNRAERENMLVDPFIDDLTDAEQRRFVRLLTPKTLREVVDAAELYEATLVIEAKRVEASASAANYREGRKKVRTITDVEDMVREIEELQVTVRSIRGQSTEIGHSREKTEVKQNNRGRSRSNENVRSVSKTSDDHTKMVAHAKK